MATKTIKVRQRGQMTLPSDVREQLGIHDGDVLEITVQGSQITLQRPQWTPRVASASPRTLMEVAGIAYLGGTATEDPYAEYDHDAR